MIEKKKKVKRLPLKKLSYALGEYLQKYFDLQNSTSNYQLSFNYLHTDMEGGTGWKPGYHLELAFDIKPKGLAANITNIFGLHESENDVNLCKRGDFNIDSGRLQIEAWLSRDDALRLMSLVKIAGLM